MATKYPFKQSGYIYSAGTKAGFLRMQRQGIPRPIFRTEDKLARTLKGFYKKLVLSIIQEFKTAAAAANIQVHDGAPLTQDSDLDDLLDFFDQMGKEYAAEQAAQERAGLGDVAHELENKWFKYDNPQPLSTEEAEKIGLSLYENQAEYLKRLFTDASGKFQRILTSFSIDKQKLFNEHMEQLRALYLDNSLERIQFEENAIKRAFLRRLTAYVTGETETLDFDDLIKYTFEKGDNMARLFARDQLSRFNKALTLSTFQDAGVTKIKWVTCHDVRVRKTHKALDGQVFNIENLPPEVDDYNCRCGLVPVEYSDD